MIFDLTSLFIGFGVGLIIIFFIWVNGLSKRRVLKKEIKELKTHLHIQMEINAKGNTGSQKELESLKKKNENLRITVATLKNKPGRADLRTLYVYDKAIHKLYEKTPGFAGAWESVLKEADEEIQQTEKGKIPLIRKIFRPSLSREVTPAITLDSEED